MAEGQDSKFQDILRREIDLETRLLEHQTLSTGTSDSDSWVSPYEKLKNLTERKKLLEDKISKTDRSQFLDRQLKKVDAELKKCQEEIKKSEELFGKALKDGSVSVSIVNTLILGEAGVGKTSTKCILFDDPLPKDRTSTPLAEAPLQVQVDSPKIPKNVSEIKVQSIANRWKALSDKQLQEIVADAVAAISVKTTSTKQYLDQLTSPTSVHGTQPQPNQTERSSLSVARPITISNIKKEIVVTTAEGDFIAPSSCLELTSWIGSNWTLTIDVDETCQFRNILPQLSDKVEASASDDKRSEKTASASDSLPETGKRAKDSSGSTVVSELYSTPVKDSFETVVANIRTKIIDLINEKKRKMLYQVLVPNEIFGSKWIYFTDSGGQPHFHNLLPHFVRGISVALFVHRLCRKLEECPMVEYYEDGQPITAPYQSSYSTGDTLKCLVRSMQSQTIKNKKPRLVFVGTFLDEIEESGENLSEKNKKLLTLLSPEFMDQLVFCTEHLKELIFSMNAKTPGIHEEEVAEKIRAVVESSPSRKIDIPIWWYVLEVTLKNLSAHLDRMVLSKQECLVVAQQLSISNDALVEALKFFHYQHIFLYYSDILPDVVFTSPQVLLDKLTELVKEAYLMRGSSSATNSSSAPRSGSWHKFRDQGILVLDFLEQFKLHYSNLFTPPDLLKIFMRHLIITPLSSDDFCQVNDFSSRFIQYYMPSLLNMLSFNELESHRVNTLRVADPLLIRFPNGWPRAGVFCCLQVYLIQQLHWKLLYKEGKPKLIAQNCVMLSPPKSSCIVTLIDSFSYFEIHVNADSDVCQKVCPLIESHIKSGIEASCRTLNYSSDEPHLAFFCSCHLTSSTGGGAPQRHVAELLKDDGCLRCSIDETVTYKMETKYTIWFQESSLLTSTSADISVDPIVDLLQRTGLSNADIDKECSDKHILKIYSNLENWERVAFHLGLDVPDIEAIETKAKRDVKLMRLYALKKWKSDGVISGTATYRVLIEALIECECSKQVLEICRLLKSTS